MENWFQNMSYHRVSDDEDWQLGVPALHNVNVLEDVSNVNLKVFDIHSLTFTLTMTN